MYVKVDEKKKKNESDVHNLRPQQGSGLGPRPRNEIPFPSNGVLGDSSARGLGPVHPKGICLGEPTADKKPEHQHGSLAWAICWVLRETNRKTEIHFGGSTSNLEALPCKPQRQWRLLERGKVLVKSVPAYCSESRCKGKRKGHQPIVMVPRFDVSHTGNQRDADPYCGCTKIRFAPVGMEEISMNESSLPEFMDFVL